MKSTTNYDMFKTLDCNRRLNETLVVRLMNNIKQCNLLERQPIEIDKDGHVFDGQHRLEAAKRLGIPIWYTETKLKKEQLHLLQEKKAWTIDDFLHYWVSLGKPEYIKFQKVCEKYHLSPAVLSKMIGIQVGRPRLAKNLRYGLFSDGSMKLPDEDIMNQRLDAFYGALWVLKDKILPGPDKQMIYKVRFSVALYSFMSHNDVDVNTFLRKLNTQADKIRPRNRVRDYMKLFQRIYNYRNSSPINIVGMDDDLYEDVG